MQFTEICKVARSDLAILRMPQCANMPVERAGSSGRSILFCNSLEGWRLGLQIRRGPGAFHRQPATRTLGLLRLRLPGRHWQRPERAAKLNKPLATAYLKEDLGQSWEQPDKATATIFLEDWIARAQASGINMLISFARTLQKSPGGVFYPLTETVGIIPQFQALGLALNS